MLFLFFRNKCVFAFLIVFLIFTRNYFKQLLYISTPINVIFSWFFLFSSWRVIIYSAFNYDTVFNLIILSINLYVIFLSSVHGRNYMVHFCRSQTHTSNSHSLFERMWPVNRVNNFAYRFRIWCHYQISVYAYCLWFLLTCKQLTRNTYGWIVPTLKI